MIFFYHKGSDYFDQWTSPFFEELQYYNNLSKDQIAVHYGLTIFKKKNLKDYLSTFYKNIFLLHGGLTFFLDNNVELYLNKLNLFDCIIVNEKIAKEYLEILGYTNVFFIGHGLPTNSVRYKCKCLDCYDQKKYEFIYSGYIHHKEHKRFLKLIKSYKHLYTSYNLSKRAYLMNYFLFFGLNKKIGLDQKELLNFQHMSKASICSNLLYLNTNDFKNFQNLKKINQLKDYEFIFKNKVAPNWKGRLFELAITKTLMLVKFDNWNIIESEFQLEPDKDFLYFNTLNDLKEIMNDVSFNFHKFIPITESAFSKVLSMGSLNYYNKIRSLDFLKN